MIEWNDNAKAAVRAFADYIGQTKKCHRYLESFASKKTIADAVEWANGKWKDDCQYMLYHEELGKFSFVVSEGPYVNGWQLVCTREQFEAYVEEQEKPQPHFKATRENLEKIAKDAQGDFVEVREKEGEKWTHTYDGQKVRWLGDKPDSCEEMAIQYQSGEYGLARVSALKPIKPTISEDSKRQLELYVQYRVDKYGDYAMKSDLSDYLSYHDIVGVSAND